MKRQLLCVCLLLCATTAFAATLKIDGEVYAQRTASLMPPAVDDLWQFNITQLAADGDTVKQGEVVLAFDGSELMKRLTEKQSLLKEKQSQFDKLLLELAERQRNEHLSTAEARSNREKAQRKTAQPEEIIGGIPYRKLMVARQQAERRATLVERREQLSAEQRVQERRLLESEVAQLQREVLELQASLAAMRVTAPRTGLMMHKSNWQGEKFDVGSQVWKGMSVAEIPDTTTLAVRAQLPERELTRVRIGGSARIVIEGGVGSALKGRVTAIGRTVRSKSRVQPIPVIDVEIKLDNPRAKLKPGQPVRVELTVADAGASP
ncbi:HlyD family secretion protein [Thermomonas sp.]|uniref:HlyD family secretion protein n=1 Tax=Thermomonas sp. TaxID=1971895 RepID=UPI002488ABD4|nr:HlyD family secretion protein [Thermomonas sp.]MDI1251766.1 efflux RND transporter periplasmic adaptor subunit [Thermomonas sp.]